MDFVWFTIVIFRGLALSSFLLSSLLLFGWVGLDEVVHPKAVLSVIEFVIIVSHKKLSLLLLLLRDLFHLFSDISLLQGTL